MEELRLNTNNIQIEKDKNNIYIIDKNNNQIVIDDNNKLTCNNLNVDNKIYQNINSNYKHIVKFGLIEIYSHDTTYSNYVANPYNYSPCICDGYVDYYNNVGIFNINVIGCVIFTTSSGKAGCVGTLRIGDDYFAHYVADNVNNICGHVYIVSENRNSVYQGILQSDTQTTAYDGHVLHPPCRIKNGQDALAIQYNWFVTIVGYTVKKVSQYYS